MSNPKTKPQAAEAPVANGTEGRFRRVASSLLKLGRQEAIRACEEHQALPHSPTERELDPRRVKELADRIRGGLWLPCNWATVLYANTRYRMNGMHSSCAMLEARDALPEEVVIHLDHYEANTPDEMAWLFRQFDARFSGRSKQDVAGAYQGLVEELKSVSREKAKLGMEGVGWYQRSIEGFSVPSNDDLYSLFFRQSFHPFLRWLDKILSIKTPELKRAPIVGAMYATFITSESGAQEFWSHVAKNDLADDSDPRAVLSQEMVRIKGEKGQGPPVAPAELYAKCVKAWNAFRNGDKIRSLNVNTKKGLPEIAA